MSVHDLEITTADANTGSTMRAEINAALQAQASRQFGGIPAKTYQFEQKIDESRNPRVIIVRNEANTAWVDVGYIDPTTGAEIYYHKGIKLISANYTATINDEIIYADATAGAITISLPQQSSVSSTTVAKGYTIIKIDSSTNTITVDPYSTETINGAATEELSSQYAVRTIIGNGGTDWKKKTLSLEQAALLASDNKYTGHQTFQGRINVASSVGGTVDAITAVFSPIFTALTDKIRVIVRATGANTSTTPTFAPDGLTAKTIVKENLVALKAADIIGASHELDLIYNSTADKWILLNPKGGGAVINSSEVTLGSDISTASAPFVSTTISLTLSVGASGVALIIVSIAFSSDGTQITSFRINRDAGTEYVSLGAMAPSGGARHTHTMAKIYTGLSSGNHTFLIEWGVSGGTSYIRPVTLPNYELLRVLGQSW